MRYYYPDYFKDFKCVGGMACPDSCCHIWQITVDRKTLKKYKTVKGPLGKRMAEKIDPKTGDICPHGDENRCEFLNDDNLCDIVSELGEDYLCETCYTHPRHEEVYDNVRERSLAITCPIVCKQLLERKEPVEIIYEDKKEIEKRDRKFDEELFEILLDARDNLLKLQQDRELTISQRMALSLGIAHDIERRIRARNVRSRDTKGIKAIFGIKNSFTDEEKEEITKILKYYKKSNAFEKMRKNIEDSEDADWFKPDEEHERKKILSDILFTLCTMEALKPTWIPYLQSVLNIRQQMENKEYDELHCEFETKLDDVEIEQLLYYFTYVYCCQSVYDEALLAKIKMAVVNTLIIKELWFMSWLENNKNITIDDKVEYAHWFVREVENSDENMEQWDSLMQRNPRFSLENIFKLL
ncbi:MAG: flagellin lysine-N-methylase [Clostridium sp.]|uniref:flagellin lysine-N-methylase n=1 Tax=Butyribacter sp. TaxID=2822465 RepID=UPI002A9B15AD|nr:flagellin lysine-N-methylase [Clostridium sp.]MDY5180250.1 flagellin lysine-N-methylase [Butyribacter sp.]